MRDIEFHIHFFCALENDRKKIRTQIAVSRFNSSFCVVHAQTQMFVEWYRHSSWKLKLYCSSSWFPRNRQWTMHIKYVCSAFLQPASISLIKVINFYRAPRACGSLYFSRWQHLLLIRGRKNLCVMRMKYCAMIQSRIYILLAGFVDDNFN